MADDLDDAPDNPDEPEGGSPGEGERPAERVPAPLPKGPIAKAPPATTAPSGAPAPTRLVSDAALTDTDKPPTEKQPTTTPTEDERVAASADRFIRMTGGDPNDPKDTKRALDKALQDNNRLSTLTREREQQEAVIGELRARVQSLEHRRDDYVPPPVEVDPTDDAQVKAIADRLVTQHPEAQPLLDRWTDLKQQRDVIATRDKSGAIVGGDLYDVRNDIADIQSNLSEKTRERLGLPALDDLTRETLQGKLDKLETRRDRLVDDYRRLNGEMNRQTDRYNELRTETAERVRQRANEARVKAAERAEAPQREAEAEETWDTAFATVSEKLRPEVADLLEEHLLFKADYVLTEKGEKGLPVSKVSEWMAAEAKRWLQSYGQGREDVLYAREKLADSRQPAPIGRGSLAIPDRSEKVTPGDRLRAANRRTSSMSRSIRAR